MRVRVAGAGDVREGIILHHIIIKSYCVGQALVMYEKALTYVLLRRTDGKAWPANARMPPCTPCVPHSDGFRR